jgi:hypothetical protein
MPNPFDDIVDDTKPAPGNPAKPAARSNPMASRRAR